MAFPGNTAWYVSTAAWALVPAWSAGASKSVGDLVKNSSPAAFSERVFVCIVAGTTHATTEPTWTLTRGAKNTDNTVTWQEATGIAGLNGDLTNTPNWTVGAKNQSISLGHVIQSNDGQKLMICTTAGTSGNGAEPTWNASVGGTTADGTATWTVLKISGNKFANWAAPSAGTLHITAATWGDGTAPIYYLSSDHAQTQSSSGGLMTSRGSAAAPMQMLSVDRTGNVPPTEADLEFGAVIEGTSGSNNDLNGWFGRMYGITFKIGNSGNTTLRPTASADKFFENCKFWINSSGSAASFNWANQSNHGRFRFKDCTFRFGATGQGINQGGGAMEEYINCSIDPAGTIPTQLFRSGGQGSIVHCHGCDWSEITGTLAGVGSGQNNGHEWLFEGCKIDAGVTPFAFAGSMAESVCYGFLDRCDSGATNYKIFWQQFTGTMEDNAEITRDDGAALPDGHMYSFEMISNANCSYGMSRFDSIKLHNYNAITAADVTVTVFGIANTATMPTDAQIFIDVDYMGDAASPQFSFLSTMFPTLDAPTNLDADTSAWDANANTRQNTHAYTVGQAIAVASNPGRVFFCTTAGTSNGSEPVGYASAVDGGSVTDGSAVFRAGWRFKIDATLDTPQPQQAGNITTRVSLGVASTTIYIDPNPVLS